MRNRFRASGIIVVLACASTSGQSPEASVQELVASGQFKEAGAFIAADQDRFVRDLIALTEIPAPPFKERARAKAFAGMLTRDGLPDVQIDAEGNVTGLRAGTGAPGGTPRAILVLSAHLDTVFPEGTDVRVKRAGTRLAAPGVGDDSRGLALLLGLLRTLNHGRFQTRMDVLFVGNVGEEGEGDLRGIKYLLQKGKYKDRIKTMLVVDGNESNGITRGGVGSKRYRVTFKGPGGHSFSAFGLVNPAYAMAGAIARLARVQVPASPKTTYSVGVVRGGTSVNSIPHEVSMDVDMRSEACGELKKLDDKFAVVVREAVGDENAARSVKDGPITAELKVIGERPCGETPMDAPIVRAAAAAITAFGMNPVYLVSSSDANIPMSLGIPAITIGRGGPGDRTHSLDEWTDVDARTNLINVQRALALLLAVDRIQ